MWAAGGVEGEAWEAWPETAQLRLSYTRGSEKPAQASAGGSAARLVSAWEREA